MSFRRQFIRRKKHERADAAFRKYKALVREEQGRRNGMAQQFAQLQLEKP